MSSLPSGTFVPSICLDLLSQALGEQIAARDDADEREVVRALVGLEDLMRDAHQRALDLVCVHADGS